MYSKNKFHFILLVLMILLGVIGFFSAPLLRDFTLIWLKDLHIGISSDSAIFRLNLLFAITLAFFPVLTGLVNFVYQAKGKYSYITPLSMLGTLLIFYCIRLYNVHEMMVEEAGKFGVSIILQLPFEQLQIENFVFVGAMVGGIVGAIFMKRLQKRGKI